jgi:hypothetical protein
LTAPGWCVVAPIPTGAFHIEKRGKTPSPANQFGGGVHFQDTSVIEHDDPVGFKGRREAVGYRQDGTLAPVDLALQRLTKNCFASTIDG